MKASEWMNILQELIDTCGDVNVDFEIIDGEVTLSAYVETEEQWT